MKCDKCKRGIMIESSRRKLDISLKWLLIFLFVVILYFAVYGKLSHKFGSDSAMPIFVGISPLVFGPLVMQFRRKKNVHGWKCPVCGSFVQDK